jgi:hypothetical protein
VTAVEGRSSLVHAAVENCRAYGIPPEQIEIHCGDVFEFLARTPTKVDTVFCFGFLYHTIRHAELLELIERSGANYIIIDTEIVQRVPRGRVPVSTSGLESIVDADTTDPNRHICRQPFQIQLIREAVADARMAIEEPLARSGRTLVARPSVEFLVFVLDHLGFDVREVDWEPYVRANPEAIADYQQGWRSTFVASRRQSDVTVVADGVRPMAAQD